MYNESVVIHQFTNICIPLETGEDMAKIVG